jgi:hypothetical protein
MDALKIGRAATKAHAGRPRKPKAPCVSPPVHAPASWLEVMHGCEFLAQKNGPEVALIDLVRLLRLPTSAIADQLLVLDRAGLVALIHGGCRVLPPEASVI